jgi:hypothetical protein
MIRVAILLDVEGDESEALHVINKVLDAGFFQEAINEASDEAPIYVHGAIVRSFGEEPSGG